MTKILITGSTGFIGREVKNILLKNSFEVLELSRNHDNLDFRCDLSDKKSVENFFFSHNPDIILHFAALSSVTEGSTLDYYKNNVLSTENLIKTLRLFPEGKRIIFLSTAGVYGNQIGVDYLHEKLCPNPISHYAFSKYICEKLFLDLASYHNITILRLFNLIGLHQNINFIIPKLVSHFAASEKSIKLGNIDPIRDYVDVDIAADIICQLIFNEHSYGEIINLCSGEGYSIRELVNILNKIRNYEIEVIKDPLLVRHFEVWKALGSTEKLKKFYPNIEKYSINMDEKLKTILNYYIYNLRGIKDENINNF